MQAVRVPGISEAKRTVLASVAIWRCDGVSAVSGKEGSMSTDTAALGWVRTLLAGAIDARLGVPRKQRLPAKGLISLTRLPLTPPVRPMCREEYGLVICGRAENPTEQEQH
jgi:hypothetical protein